MSRATVSFQGTLRAGLSLEAEGTRLAEEVQREIGSEEPLTLSCPGCGTLNNLYSLTLCFPLRQD